MRFATIIIGIGCFLWLSLEDTQTAPVVVLGTGLSSLLVLAWWRSLPLADRSGRRGAWIMILMGALAGASAVLTITLLMFIKTAWHSHLYPDYPVLMMVAMLERLPLWTLAGAILGVGLVSLRYTTPEGSTNPDASAVSGTISTIADKFSAP